MPSWSVSWSAPRTWFVSARLLEIAALLLVLGSAHESWVAFRATGRQFGPNGEILQAGPPLLDRLTMFSLYGTVRAPLAVVLAALLLCGALGVLHLAGTVSNARLLRWEVAGVAALNAVLASILAGVTVLALFGGDPFRADGTVTFETGPGLTEQVLLALPVPVAALLLMAVVGLWWLRLPPEFSEPDDEPVKAKPARLPAPDANSDDIVLDGVEFIEPVERLRPREGSPGDGSTPSGYEDYFRRT